MIGHPSQQHSVPSLSCLRHSAPFERFLTGRRDLCFQPPPMGLQNASSLLWRARYFWKCYTISLLPSSLIALYEWRVACCVLLSWKISS
jgi:hypothetical protein